MMESNKIYKYTILIWTIIIIAVYTFVSNQRIESTKNIAKHIVDSSLQQDKMFRQWASSHGGFYVKTDKRTPPNPNLAHIENRDIEYKDVKLTLMNPAYMLRQMMHEYSGLYGLKGHITSLRVFNKEYNLPDEWEKSILIQFEKNKDSIKTVYEFVKKGEKEYLKAFEPLVIQKSCLKCHAVQGYALGDIRGGVSVTLPMDELLKQQNSMLLNLSILFLIIYCIGFFIIKIFYNKAIKEQKTQNKLQKQLRKSEEYFKTIVNTTQNIILVNDDEELEKVNNSFFEFTGFSSLEEFKKEYHCICDMFVKRDGYLSKYVDGIYWLRYVAINPNETHKAIIKKDGREFTFSINVNEFRTEGRSRYVAVFNDITELVEKEKALLVQSKMAAMGEMLENIAHQWRQPLSVISASASGAKFKKEYGSLSDDDLVVSLDNITKSTEYLSTTIDDFRDFFKVNKEKESFNISDTYKKAIMLLSSKFKNRAIHLIENLEDIILTGYKNEMIQAILNILNNAKDALEDTAVEERYIFTTIEKQDNEIFCSIKDTAGGIPEEYRQKVFDQRFTSKADHGGTGIGLYMTKQIIEKLEGSIDVQNTTFTYNEKEYTGAEFIIKIPLAENL